MIKGENYQAKKIPFRVKKEERGKLWTLFEDD
jgi:hypothetical protein